VEGKSPKINQRVELQIEGVGAGCEGIGRLDGRAVFVPRTLPEERVLARIVHVGSKKIAAEPQKILEPSPDRRDPVCPAFGRCGGCQLMHADYPAQLELKRTILKDALRSIAGIEIESIPVTGAEEPLCYRNRGQYPVARRKGKIVTGFFAPRTHDVVAVSKCYIHDPRVDRAVACVRSWAGKRRSRSTTSAATGAFCAT
jgi:23S rRNA (uracil1939-C5)-methyltransferase